MIEDLIRIAIRTQITGLLSNIVGSLFSGFFAKGGAFDGGVQKFATGGIVMSPTLFGMAGGAGLMGEAGPEAIMPLTRTASGHLGVRSASNSSRPIIIRNEIVNQTSQPVQGNSGATQFDGETYIVQTILNNVERNGPLRGLMAGGRGY